MYTVRIDADEAWALLTKLEWTSTDAGWVSPAGAVVRLTRDAIEMALTELATSTQRITDGVA